MGKSASSFPSRSPGSGDIVDEKNKLALCSFMHPYPIPEPLTERSGNSDTMLGA